MNGIVLWSYQRKGMFKALYGSYLVSPVACCGAERCMTGRPTISSAFWSHGTLWKPWLLCDSDLIVVQGKFYQLCPNGNINV